MRVAFRCDASPGIGGGHVMRCLALARALRERGHDVVFVSTAVTNQTVRALEEGPFPVLPLDHADVTGEAAAVLLEQKWNGIGDIVVVDSYALGAPAEARFRRLANRIVVLDDLADREHDCDLIIDQTYGRTKDAYQGLIPDACLALTGTRYALLRPEFAQARASATARRAQITPCNRILVTMGLTDVGAISERVVTAIAGRHAAATIDVVVGRHAPSLPSLIQMRGATPGVEIHIDTDELCHLMVEADLAIGGAGSTMWERCCLGLPTVALVLADNQSYGAKALDAAGCCVALDARAGLKADFAAAVEDLARDGVRRYAMATRALDVCDGLGVARVIDHLEGL